MQGDDAHGTDALSQAIDRAQKREFFIVQDPHTIARSPKSFKIFQGRVEKMVARGWTCLNPEVGVHRRQEPCGR